MGPAEGVNVRFSIRGAGHADGIDSGPLGGEAEVLRRVRLDVGVVEGAGLDLGGTFAEGLPWGGRVDSLAVYLEPCAHLEQPGAHVVGNSAVGPGAEVEEQVAVLAHDVD